MAKNLSRKFATMSEEERRRFALEEDEGTSTGEHPTELAFDEPRNEENVSSQYSSIREEMADPEHRDGMSALLDDEQHKRAVQDAARQQGQQEN